MVPTRPAGIAYHVRYGILLVAAAEQHGRGLTPVRWAKCSVRLLQAGQIPNGSYYLYTEEGRVHQLKSIEGKWQYLTAAD